VKFKSTSTKLKKHKKRRRISGDISIYKDL